MRNQLLYYAIKYKGEYFKIKKAIENNEDYEIIKYEGNYITILDAEYPKQLLRLKYKPYVLFYEGNLDLLKNEYISVVGSRNISDYGKQCIVYLCQYVNKKYGIVSGLAKGCDAYAHKEAIYTNKNTIAVLGNGIDIYYPYENKDLYEIIKKKGLILSEYPNGTKPYAYHFPWRNRIVAALSNHLIVVEAKKISGTMITVNEALDVGNDIYCFPHSIFDENGEGCNQIINNGAYILYDKNSIEEI